MTRVAGRWAWSGSFRVRLTATLMAVVAVTAVVVGTTSVLLVESSLRRTLVADSLDDARFALTTLADAVGLPPSPTPADLGESGLVDRILARGADDVVVVPDGAAVGPGGLVAQLDPAVVALVADGELGWQFLDRGGREVLVVGGRRPPSGPDVYLVTATDEVAATTSAVVGTTVAVAVGVALVGLLAAWWLARGILRPVGEASAAARRMAAGDLDTRLPTGDDDVGRLGLAFNSMAASLADTISTLRAAEESQRRFVADSSHELRTPLTGLVSAAGLLPDRLARTGADDETRALAEIVDREAGRLRDLVEDLLEMSRLDAPAAADPATDLDVTHLVRALVRQRLPTADVDVTVDRPVRLAAHPVERIVGNLVDNARIHADGREVAVTVRLLGRGVGAREVDGDEHVEVLEMVVADRGPGIAAADLERVFDRFATGAGPGRGGAGLGLAIARDHARRLGGDLTASPRDGGGLVVRATIPVARSLRGGDGVETPPSEDGVIR